MTNNKEDITRTRHDDRLKWLLSHLHYEMGLSQIEIVEITHINATSVSRILKQAKDERFVRFRVIDPKAGSLKKLENELIKTYELRDARLVYGHETVFKGDSREKEDVIQNLNKIAQDLKEDKDQSTITLESLQKKVLLSDESITNIQESIADDLAEEAAAFLDERCNDEDCISLAWGQMVRNVVGHLHPSEPKPLLKIVPMIGIRNFDRYDANAICQDVAYIYGSTDFKCIPFPAVSGDDKLRKAIESSKLWQEVEEYYGKCMITLSTTAPINREGSAVKYGFTNQSDLDKLEEMNAIAEINSHYFDSEGSEINTDINGNPITQPIGMNLKTMKEIAKKGGLTILTAGIKENRYGPIRACLKGGIINVLITDHITAKRLIKEK